MNKLHLKNLYDTINKIAAEHQAKGRDRSAWFYSDDEFEKIKRDERNTLL